MTTNHVNVLIVDDSAVVRQVLGAVLEQDPAIRVIGSAPDPIYAMQRMNRNWPDVVVLDVEMPRMDGITFLKELMVVRPTPVVICSTLTERGAQTTLEALSAGAVAIVTKPKSGQRDFLKTEGADIARTVREAARGNMRRMTAVTNAVQAMPRQGQAPSARSDSSAARLGASPAAMSVTTDRIVAIGTSTGGTQALELVLSSMPRIMAGIVIVQHMPEKFTAAFAARLDARCDAAIVEASDGDRVLPGRVLIAPAAGTCRCGGTARNTG
jgi:two-component system chemotaxis response regulator CheB